MHTSRTGNFTGTEASRTDVDVSGRAVHDCLDALHVGLPGPIGTTMGMIHMNAELDVLFTKFALSHLPNILALRNSELRIDIRIVDYCNRFSCKNQENFSLFPAKSAVGRGMELTCEKAQKPGCRAGKNRL